MSRRAWAGTIEEPAEAVPPADGGPAVPVVLRPMAAADLAFAVEGHRRHLPSGFFVRLGPRFLRCYYRGFSASPYGVAVVAEVEGRPVGSLVGTTCQARHYRWLLRRRGVVLAFTGATSLLVRPAELRSFARGRLWRYTRAIPRMVGGKVLGRRADGERPDVDLTVQKGGDDQGGAAGSVAVLHHVFVSPDVSSNGVGSCLVERFQDEARRGGAEEARLVTVADDSAHSAVGFYQRIGWQVRDRRRDRDGRDVVELSQRLT